MAAAVAAAAAAAGGEVKTLSPPELLHTNQIQENRHRKWQEGCQHKVPALQVFQNKSISPPRRQRVELQDTAEILYRYEQ